MSESKHPALKILIVVTSHARLGETGKPTGLWLDELAAPYVVFTRAGAEVDIASPAGGAPPIDPRSEQGLSAEAQIFRADGAAAAKLASTKTLAEVLADDSVRYDAVMVAGGHGAMWDLGSSPEVAAILSKAYAAGAVVSAVCHGPAALVGAKQPGGRPLVEGHRVTGFSNEEEAMVKLTDVVPFLLEDKLRALGGRYEHGPILAPFVVSDGKLVTGQNPTSSVALATEVLAVLARHQAS